MLAMGVPDCIVSLPVGAGLKVRVHGGLKRGNESLRYYVTSTERNGGCKHVMRPELRFA